MRFTRLGRFRTTTTRQRPHSLHRFPPSPLPLKRMGLFPEFAFSHIHRPRLRFSHYLETCPAPLLGSKVTSYEVGCSYPWRSYEPCEFAGFSLEDTGCGLTLWKNVQSCVVNPHSRLSAQDALNHFTPASLKASSLRRSPRGSSSVLKTTAFPLIPVSEPKYLVRAHRQR